MKLTLREWRRARGISAEEFANELGIARSTLDKWENGDTKKIPIQSALKACDILNITINDIDFG